MKIESLRLKALPDILSGQKFIKNAKTDQFGEFLKTWTMLPDRSILIGQKLVENTKNKKFKCDILRNFQTMWSSEIELIDLHGVLFRVVFSNLIFIHKDSQH